MLGIGLPAVMSLGIDGAALAGVFLAMAGYWVGLGLVAAEFGALIAYSVTQTGDVSYVAGSIAWAVVLVAVGFGLEPLAERIGTRIYRLSHQTLMYASVAMLVVMFVAGLTWMIPAAFVGAVLGGMMSGISLNQALTDGVGALLAIFGPKGIRLLCACSLAALVVAMSGLALATSF